MAHVPCIKMCSKCSFAPSAMCKGLDFSRMKELRKEWDGTVVVVCAVFAEKKAK